MKRNYWVGGFVIVVILFLNSSGLTQQTEDRSNQGGVNESQINYVIGLRTNAAPISYRDSDNSDNSDNFKGYCHAFLETLKQKVSGDIKTVSVSRGKRFTGQGDNGEKLDALCGPDTITTGRKTRELQEKDLDGKFSNPFAWTSIAVLLEKKNEENFLHPTLEQELKIGVLNGTTTKEVIKALYPSLFQKINYYNDFKKAFDKLNKGDIIAYFDDEILLRGKFQQISSTEKEYVILPIPSIIEYGIVVFHTKEKKNYELLQEINNLLKNAKQEKIKSTTIKILENNQNFQNFIDSVEQKKPEDNFVEPSPIQSHEWLLVLTVIMIICVIIWLSFQKISSKKNKSVSPIHSQINIDDTLDLYHNSGVDPRALAISFKQLAENHPDAELEIVAMEKRGEDKFLLRAKTSLTADKSELSAEYFTIYNELKALAKQELKALMEEKDSRISSLETMVKTALQSPKFYTENYHNQGDTTMGGDKRSLTAKAERTINMGDGNYNERIEGNYVQGDYYAAREQSLAEAAAQIQQLLQQLEQSYPSNTTTGKMAIATEAIKYIESDRTLAERILNALKAGGTEALAQLLNHPAASFVIGALHDWQKTKGS